MVLAEMGKLKGNGKAASSQQANSQNGAKNGKKEGTGQ